jgi:hypothetical protein
MVAARYLPGHSRDPRGGLLPSLWVIFPYTYIIIFTRHMLTYVPGTYIISTWYVRREIQKRLTGFYVLAVMVSWRVSPCTALN